MLYNPASLTALRMTHLDLAPESCVGESCTSRLEADNPRLLREHAGSHRITGRESEAADRRAVDHQLSAPPEDAKVKEGKRSPLPRRETERQGKQQAVDGSAVSSRRRSHRITDRAQCTMMLTAQTKTNITGSVQQEEREREKEYLAPRLQQCNDQQ